MMNVITVLAGLVKFGGFAYDQEFLGLRKVSVGAWQALRTVNWRN